jgi:hypothetical protein
MSSVLLFPFPRDKSLSLLVLYGCCYLSASEMGIWEHGCSCSFLFLTHEHKVGEL